jgi:hypothetical protein
MTGASELEILVETERRLDEAVAAARSAADATRAAARSRTQLAFTELERQIDAERIRAAHEMTAELAARERAIEQAATSAIARYEAVRGEVLDRIATLLARRVLAISEEP